MRRSANKRESCGKSRTKVNGSERLALLAGSVAAIRETRNAGDVAQSLSNPIKEGSES